MSRTRLIKRLQWYYPTEKFHTYVTVPALLLYVVFTNPLHDIIFIAYGLIVCTVILYQGQFYWKLKLDRLTGKSIQQEESIRFFNKSKRLNWILISLMPLFLLIQLYLQSWNISTSDMLYWGLLANIFAILEHINYYYIQLMIDNKYDIQYVLRNKRLKKASLAKDLEEHRI